MHGFGFGGFGWISMILNWIIIIGFIVGLVLLIVWLARKISPNGFMKGEMSSSQRATTSPREILQARYASGEITKEQYKEILADLT